MLDRAGIDPAVWPTQTIRSPPIGSHSCSKIPRARSGCSSFGLLMAETRTVASTGRGRPAAKDQSNARGRDRSDRRNISACWPKRSRSASRTSAGPPSSGPTFTTGLGRATGDRAADGVGLPEDQRGGRPAAGIRRARISSTPRPPIFPRTAASSSAHLVFGSDFNGFACPTAWLDAPNPAAELGDGAPRPALSRHAGPRARRRRDRRAGAALALFAAAGGTRHAGAGRATIWAFTRARCSGPGKGRPELRRPC